MTESLFSTYWYRVANLKPVLRDTAIVSRHVYRGQPWYILRNKLNGRNHRFNSAAYTLIGQMDGGLTVQELWDNACKLNGDTAPTQGEVIRLLGKLHDADLIQSEILSSTVELVRQYRGYESNNWKQKVSNPLSIRIPLWDPDRFLEKCRFLTAPLFTFSALILWLVIVLTAIVAAILNWPELTGNLSDRLFLPKNLLLLWMVYPLIKIVHEFGHAFAVKKWGGEVHEMGITLLVFTPIPYVDATASVSFPEKKHRIAAAAMGMMAELLIASIALFVWLNVETGIISAIAYNVIIIGGMSTILFNGNPLLRYDGYFILADLIEIPNLAQRSTLYIGYLLQRYLLGIDTIDSPVTAPGEKAWFLVFGPLSLCYRLAVMIGLVLLVGSRFFSVGVLIALWITINLLVIPTFRTISNVLKRSAIRSRRFRLYIISLVIVISTAVLIFIAPVPLWTSTQGVVWLPEQSVIRAGTDCEVIEIVAPVEEFVSKNTTLIRGADPFLKAEIELYKTRLEELYAMYNAKPFHERVKRKIILDDIEIARKELQDAEEKLGKLLIRSPAQGKFIMIDARNLPGRFVKKGELLGYIIAEHRPTVRAVVKQEDIGLVRKRLTGVEVRLAEQPVTLLSASIERIVPAADHKLPSAALGTGGGGIFPVDPTDPEGLRAMDRIFQVDISLPDKVKNAHIGGRVYLRFEHGTMPLAMQWYRSLRQLFLRKFYA